MDTDKRYEYLLAALAEFTKESINDRGGWLDSFLAAYCGEDWTAAKVGSHQAQRKGDDME